MPAKPKEDARIFLKVKQIKLFPPAPDAEIQLSIFVNATEFKHPSIGGVEWMKVGPAMSEKIIEVPASSYYDVRFEMRLRKGPTLESGRQNSNTIMFIENKALPYSDQYHLYGVDGVTRRAGVSAVVSYEMYGQ